MTWLFLAPAALPSFFGDPAPGAPPAARPYLRPVAGPGPIVMAPARSPEPAATPAPPIPRWADPMVHPKVAGPVRPPVSHRPAHLTREPAPRAAAPEVPEPPPPLPRPTEAQLFDGLPDIEETDPVGLPTLPDERADPSPPPRGAEILDELDRLEAELRSFVPVDAALRPPAGVARRGGSGI